MHRDAIRKEKWEVKRGSSPLLVPGFRGMKSHSMSLNTFPHCLYRQMTNGELTIWIIYYSESLDITREERCWLRGKLFFLQSQRKKFRTFLDDLNNFLNFSLQIMTLPRTLLGQVYAGREGKRVGESHPGYLSGRSDWSNSTKNHTNLFIPSAVFAWPFSISFSSLHYPKGVI